MKEVPMRENYKTITLLFLEALAFYRAGHWTEYKNTLQKLEEAMEAK